MEHADYARAPILLGGNVAIQIGDRVYCCENNGRLVFLNLDEDRYFCLAEALDAQVKHLLAVAPTTVCVHDLPEELQRQVGFHQGDFIAIQKMSTPPQLMKSLCDGCRPSARISSFLESLWYQSCAAWQLKHKPLVDIVRRMQAVKRRGSQRTARPSAGVEATAAGFRLSRLIVNNHDKCLQRSVALIDCLATRRQFPLFVIGVRVNPFSAHAWVQDGVCLLNDEIDNVLPYAPILIV